MHALTFLLSNGLVLFRYVHILIQKMAVNVDLGFILAIVDFFKIDIDPLLEVSLYSRGIVVEL